MLAAIIVNEESKDCEKDESSGYDSKNQRLVHLIVVLLFILMYSIYKACQKGQLEKYDRGSAITVLLVFDLVALSYFLGFLLVG